MKYGLVLKEKNFVNGLTRNDVMNLFDILDDTEAFPIEFEAKEHECSAMGFISYAAADSFGFDYITTGLHNFIASILDDMEKESNTCEYTFNDIKIWLSR